jgi:hypothetical protein
VAGGLNLPVKGPESLAATAELWLRYGCALTGRVGDGASREPGGLAAQANSTRCAGDSGFPTGNMRMHTPSPGLDSIWEQDSAKLYRFCAYISSLFRTLY